MSHEHEIEANGDAHKRRFNIDLRATALQYALSARGGQSVEVEVLLKDAGAIAAWLKAE